MDWQEDLRQRLTRPLPGRDAQLRFSPRPTLRSWDPAATPAEARLAAALVLLYPTPQGPAIVLTLRRADLPHHAGQISLPGGRLDPGETPEAGALREAQEEVGLAPDSVRVIGRLSTLWVLVSRFVVHPIVAVAGGRPVLTACPREVDAIIEVPLADLRAAGGVRWGRRVRDGLTVVCPYFAVPAAPVWGATAMMLGELCTVLDPAFGPPEPPLPTALDALPSLG